MGNCVYCGQDAGFLRKMHDICKEMHEAGQKMITGLVATNILSQLNIDQLNKTLDEIAEKSFIRKDTIKDLKIAGWEAALNSVLADNFLSIEEENKLAEARDKFFFQQNELDKHGCYTRLVQSSVLREVLEGKIPEKIKIDRQPPFNFQKNEKLVWLFQEVAYYEQKTRKQFVGGSQGFSMRIAKGVYYRVGAFRGEAVEMIFP